MMENYISKLMFLLGCILALIDCKALAVLFWMAGVAWRSEI